MEKLQEIEKRMESIINSEEFYKYDLKEEIFKDYEKIYKRRMPVFPKDDVEKQKNWKQIKAFDSYVKRIENARKIIETVSQKNNINCKDIFSKEENQYKYIKRYLLFKYQTKYDCDTSYLVYKFYQADTIDIDIKTGIPRYFDTYFSVQSLWGKLINNLYGDRYIKKDENQNIYVGNDFIWQLKNFDEIIIKDISEDLKKLYEAFDEFAHYYHTIGNIAPCAPRINSPKGFAFNCYDRIDLFLKKEINENWLSWYYGNVFNLPKNISNNVTKFHLEEFINPKKLNDNIEIPKNKDDKKQIENLTMYITNIKELIEKRGKFICGIGL